MSRVTEDEVAKAVEAILKSRASGQATIQELVAEIPRHLGLSEEDMKQSETRPNEAVWEQQVRNITSHKNSPGNAIYEGRLVAIPSGLALPTSLSKL
jgi:DNA-binding protein H-NS